MLNLIKNEWIKIFKQVSTYIMIGFLLLVIIGVGGITKYVESKEKPANDNWKQELTAQNEQNKQQLADIEFAAPSLKEYLTKETAINEYRIEHNMPPENSYSVWSFIKDSSDLTSFVGLLVIIIASGIVAHEFSWGTIKILLIKPYSRWKILMAKYITTILYLLTMLAILFTIVSILGLILFGKGTGDNVHLAYVNGAVVEQNLLLYLIKTYILNSLSVFLLTTMAFMISAVFRNSGLAIGISIFLLLMGGTITNLLAAKFDWAKYSLFANTNLMQYVDGMPLVEGMTLSFSIIMIIIYFIIFHAMAFVFFTKRDIAT
ncbi:ABC transporter permease [Lederbergia wuyishanensis]|uniref:ABC-2 type transport system permease protein n=1 Tax=Lederbergia wuyishanensis TaxID=1347903 RepID=A0ABU0D7G4_9BACI|nr:ABC transporter permease [Lederbergia wuyishanensis]MCJ8008980.1 ABC transporter permease [Lederbergia wuyishanensis]MDQ0344310.1 ABC-2 type transport system permease protein [Lederbergia wuyishanensis]